MRFLGKKSIFVGLLSTIFLLTMVSSSQQETTPQRCYDCHCPSPDPYDPEDPNGYYVKVWLPHHDYIESFGGDPNSPYNPYCPNVTSSCDPCHFNYDEDCQTESPGPQPWPWEGCVACHTLPAACGWQLELPAQCIDQLKGPCFQPLPGGCFEPPGGGYQCGDCHAEGEPIRKCQTSGCHDTVDNGNHHTKGVALAGMCSVCHDPNLVKNYDETKPLSHPVGELTPMIQTCGAVQGPDPSSPCHKAAANPLDGNGDPYPYPIYETRELEHMDLQGHVAQCTLCHGDPPEFDPQNPYLIRHCETCHTMDSLHIIPGHVEDGFWYDENGNWTEITGNDRCLGCHFGELTMLYVPQDMGTYDTLYSELKKKDCRGCHGNKGTNAARHHALLGSCVDPPSPPVISADACEGMSPIVGARMARVSLTGTDFGENPGTLKCGDYKVQLKAGPEVWVDVPVVTWTETVIEWVLPPWTFEPDNWYRVRVKTPAGNSNKRKFKVLPTPVVDRIEDDTGNDSQGRVGGWLTVYSQVSGDQGTFSGSRKKWYEDDLGGTCPKHFGRTYVVSFTSASNRFCAGVYDEWNISGNKDSFKVWLDDWWEDADGDYKKDASESSFGSGHPLPIPANRYSMQVCLITYADTNENDKYSGNKDTIYQIVKSQFGFIYEILTDPVITELVPNSTPPSQPGSPQIVEIRGQHFGYSQGASALHIGGKTWYEGHSKIKLWSDTLIKFKVPAYDPPFPKYKNVWVTVGGVDSNKEQLEIIAP